MRKNIDNGFTSEISPIRRFDGIETMKTRPLKEMRSLIHLSIVENERSTSYAKFDFIDRTEIAYQN